MKTFFVGVEWVLIVSTVTFIAGVLFSQKIKDAFKGIPSDVRAQLTSIETAVRGKLTASHTAVIAPAVAAVGATGPQV